MKKSEFKKKIAGMFNEVRYVDGVTVARVCWKNNPWMVVKYGTDFEDCANPDFLPVASFRTGEDLYHFVYETVGFKTV